MSLYCDLYDEIGSGPSVERLISIKFDVTKKLYIFFLIWFAYRCSWAINEINLMCLRCFSMRSFQRSRRQRIIIFKLRTVKIWAISNNSLMNIKYFRQLMNICFSDYFTVEIIMLSILNPIKETIQVSKSSIFRIRWSWWLEKREYPRQIWGEFMYIIYYIIFASAFASHSFMFFFLIGLIRISITPRIFSLSASLFH